MSPLEWWRTHREAKAAEQARMDRLLRDTSEAAFRDLISDMPVPPVREIHGKTAPELAAADRLEAAWAPIRDYLVNDEDMKSLVADLIDPPSTT